MFKHLLLPTDGSLSSHDAIEKAVGFAKGAQAQVLKVLTHSKIPVLVFR